MESSPFLRAQEGCGACKAFRVCFSCYCRSRWAIFDLVERCTGIIFLLETGLSLLFLFFSYLVSGRRYRLSRWILLRHPRLL